MRNAKIKCLSCEKTFTQSVLTDEEKQQAQNQGFTGERTKCPYCESTNVTEIR